MKHSLEWVRRCRRTMLVPALLLLALPVGAAAPAGLDQQIEDAQGDVAAYQEELSVLDTVVRGLETKKLLVTGNGFELVSQEYFENTLAQRVANHTTTPQQAVTLARTVGLLTRAVMKALKEQLVDSRLALATAQDRLARLTREKSRLAVNVPPPPVSPTAGVINVASATYGTTCNQPVGNATRFVKPVCDGKPVCEYTVRVEVIGDPAFGCRKDFNVQWSCSIRGGGSTTAAPEAGYGSKVLLRC